MSCSDISIIVGSLMTDGLEMPTQGFIQDFEMKEWGRGEHGGSRMIALESTPTHV